MPRFFIADPVAVGDYAVLSGPDAGHISMALRMRPGEKLTLCDGERDYMAEITAVSRDRVETRVNGAHPCVSEPSLRLTVALGLPKSDKAEYVVQKCTELGASRILIFRSARCIPNPDKSAFQKRLARLRRIAAEAAGQSERGRVPYIDGVVSFEFVTKTAGDCSLPLFFYEKGGEPLRKLINPSPVDSIVVIGPEGGFEPEEAELARKSGFLTATLGPRILRCETAAITATAAVMYACAQI